MSDSTALLRQLLGQLERIWQAYLKAGPGGVDAVLLEDVESSGGRLIAELPESAAGSDLREAIQTGVELGRRCVQRPEGLCFVTGEAGLVPRRDLHEKFEAALKTMRAALEERSP